MTLLSPPPLSELAELREVLHANFEDAELDLKGFVWRQRNPIDRHEPTSPSLQRLASGITNRWGFGEFYELTIAGAGRPDARLLIQPVLPAWVDSAPENDSPAGWKARYSRIESAARAAHEMSLWPTTEKLYTFAAGFVGGFVSANRSAR